MWKKFSTAARLDALGAKISQELNKKTTPKNFF
jgi:hypothetical protein